MSSAKSVKNGDSLVIVESPAKAKTITRYLGKGYQVLASMGHVRDLPSKSLSVDVTNDFEPTYEILPTRRKALASLKKAAKDAPLVYLATDLDREGEAIAWHLSEALNVKADRQRRVVFNAITKRAIQEAFSHPLKLNLDKVNAQQARRILDRIVGYEISPLLWKKVARGLSAGRVQSVAVKLIVTREREILAFEPQEYWKITGVFSTAQEPALTASLEALLGELAEEKGGSAGKRAQWLSDHGCVEAQLTSVGGKSFRPDNGEETARVHASLQGASFEISQVTTKRTQSSPPPPFITSTLQQQAANRLGYSTKRTMQLAQQLYEGMELGGLGSIGLITYMRTDSTQLAPEAVGQVRDFVGAHYGSDYLPEKARVYGKKTRGAQEAHEAIRPTDVSITPESIRDYLDNGQFRLYELIWKRYVACQMAPAKWDVTSVSIAAPSEAGEVLFRASGRKLVFDGFMRASGLTITSGEQLLPALEKQQQVWPVSLAPTQHFTSPPARFTEASLVKTLEAEGIGRPSTYASIISTIQDRGYVEQLDRKFHATDLGMVVTDKLSEHFPRVMDVAFTSAMEERLDKIEEQHLNWVEVLREFYGPFKENLDRAHEQMRHAKAETQPSEYTCSKCEAPLVYRFGKNGRFLSCSTYPTCKFAAPCDREGKIAAPETTEHACPTCGKAMILRQGRFGRFLGCSAYPECKTVQKLDKEGQPLPPKAPPEPSGLRCYKCAGDLVIRQSKRGPFLGCGRFPKCRTIISIKQLDHLKELQQQGAWPPATTAEADEMLGRKKKAATTKTPAPRAKKKASK